MLYVLFYKFLLLSIIVINSFVNLKSIRYFVIYIKNVCSQSLDNYLKPMVVELSKYFEAVTQEKLG